MIALFVIMDDNGEMMCFSREVADTLPETLREVVKDNGFRVHEVQELFIIEGELSTPGREYLGEDDLNRDPIDGGESDGDS